MNITLPQHQIYITQFTNDQIYITTFTPLRHDVYTTQLTELTQQHLHREIYNTFASDHAFRRDQMVTRSTFACKAQYF